MNYYILFSARHVSNSLTYLTKNLLLVLVLTGTHLMAQQTVNGTVSDAQGPLPGATIVVQGSNIGVTSDFDGNFSIEANPGDVLEISHVGLLTQQYTVLENQDTIEILLELDNRLEEVVVTGYGTQRKSDVT